MKHNLEECDLNTNHLDNCDLCGELTACVCLGAIVDEWEIEPTSQGGLWAYRYQYKEKGSLTARFGYAESYREAMDTIAHSAICEKEEASA
jgi:hypothetical protein